jgi:hypothetical protein
MKLTNEQLNELITAYEQANDDDLSLTISFLKELKELRSNIVLTKAQWIQIREALEDSKERMELSHDPDVDESDDLIFSIVKALELMDSIHKETP